MNEEKYPVVSCPGCGEEGLIGPVDEGFMCYKCGYTPEQDLGGSTA